MVVEAGGLAVGEVLPHSAMGVNVHQAGDHVAPGGIQVRRAVQLSDGGDSPVELDVGVQKRLSDEYFCVFDQHSSSPSSYSLLGIP